MTEQGSSKVVPKLLDSSRKRVEEEEEERKESNEGPAAAAVGVGDQVTKKEEDASKASDNIAQAPVAVGNECTTKLDVSSDLCTANSDKEDGNAAQETLSISSKALSSQMHHNKDEKIKRQAAQISHDTSNSHTTVMESHHLQQPGAFQVGSNSETRVKNNEVDIHKPISSQNFSMNSTRDIESQVLPLDENSANIIQGTNSASSVPNGEEVNCTPPANTGANDSRRESSQVTSHESTFSAELVTETPLEGVAMPVQVIFDEHSEALHNDLEHDSPRSHNPLRQHHTDRPTPFKVVWMIALVIVIVVMCIVIPTVVVDTGRNGNDHNDYECFTSTRDLLFAQQNNPQQDLFILCPSTKIKIGHLINPASNNLDWQNGDVPLMAMRSNITIQCGLDGSLQNDCQLVGGFLQVLVQSFLPTGNDGIMASATHNVTIQGVTFTGQISTDLVFGGASVIVSNPGSVELVDCIWKDLTAPSSLIYIGTNEFQEQTGYGEPLDPQVASLTFRNCTFQDLVYDGPFASTWKQNISFIGCTIENVQLSSFLHECFIPGIEGCQSFLLCMENAVCNLQDICINDFEYATEAAIVLASNDSTVNLEGFYSIEEIKKHPSIASMDTCNEGVAWFELGNAGATKCMNTTEFESWTSTDACPLH